MIYKVLVDSSSLEYAKLKAICPIIVSAEFLKRARERFLKTADRTMRIGSIASVALAPYTPVFSPQKEGGSPKDSGHTLAVDTLLNLDGIPKTFEAPDGRRVIFNNIEREQVQSQEVSVFGVQAGFNERGNILLSTIDGSVREIVLPRVSGFVYGGAKFSPDGTRIAVWRQYRDGPPPVEHDTYLVETRTGKIAAFVLGFLENLGQFPTLLSFTWSPDGKKLAFAAGQHGGGKTIGVDMETGKVLFELPGSDFGDFSPDGNWFAKVDIKGENLEIVSMSGIRLVIPDSARAFSWSQDNRSIAFHKCLMWSEGGQGPYCNVSRLSVFDLERQEFKNFVDSMSYVRPVFSPDGRKIAFREFNNTRIAMLSILDINSGRRTSINFPSEEVPLNHDWSLRFYGNERLLAWGRKFRDPRTHLLWLDSGNASVISQQWLSQRGYNRVLLKEIVGDRIICEIQDNRGGTGWGITQIANRDGELVVTPLVYFSGASPVGASEIFALVREGERVVSGDQNFLFLGGKKRLIEHEETAGYFGEQKSSIPEGLARFVPEGESIQFRPGDVVGHKDLGLWYLRSGKRYKIQNWDWFKNNQRFNVGENLEFRRGEWIVSKELIERIPEGEVPQPAPSETFIRDWDGSFKEFQPYGGRMFIFMGGHDSGSESQKQAFEFIKSLLREYGQSDLHFGEGTYNVMETERGLFPLGYSPPHTYRDPLESIYQTQLLIQWYKERFPLTRFVLIGHSLGGFVLFNAAVAHTDAIEAVITLDSPIGGIDKSLLTRLTEVGDEVVARWAKTFQGSVVGRFLIDAGDNPKFRQEAEAQAWHMISRGVTVITATNDDDILIPSWSAVLEGPLKEAEKREIQLVWKLGHANLAIDIGDWSLNFRSGSHGLILGDRDVWVSYIEGLSLP